MNHKFTITSFRFTLVASMVFLLTSRCFAELKDKTPILVNMDGFTILADDIIPNEAQVLIDYIRKHELQPYYQLRSNVNIKEESQMLLSKRLTLAIYHTDNLWLVHKFDLKLPDTDLKQIDTRIKEKMDFDRRMFTAVKSVLRDGLGGDKVFKSQLELSGVSLREFQLNLRESYEWDEFHAKEVKAKLTDTEYKARFYTDFAGPCYSNVIAEYAISQLKAKDSELNSALNEREEAQKSTVKERINRAFDRVNNRLQIWRAEQCKDLKIIVRDQDIYDWLKLIPDYKGRVLLAKDITELEQPKKDK